MICESGVLVRVAVRATGVESVVGMPWRASSLSKREIMKSSVNELGEMASREMMKDSYDGGRLV